MTSRRRLRGAASPNPRLEPLLRGEVSDPALDVAWTVAHPAALFRRHLTENAFDVFECSLSAYLEVRCATATPLRWTALPVFLSKAMLPFELLVRRDSGIRDWSDLRDRTLGVPDVHMTAAVWLRLMLRELHGVPLEAIGWVNGRPPEKRHSTMLPSPHSQPRLRVRECAPGETLQSLLEDGGIDAAFGDHAEAAVVETPGLRRLCDAQQAQRTLESFMQQTGATPVNHVMVLQQAVADEPGVASRLLRLLAASKDAAQADPARYGRDEPALQPAVFGSDPYPFGVTANQRMLSLLLDQLASEGRLQDRHTASELFIAD